MRGSSPHLASVVAQAQSAWPTITLDADSFGRYLVQRDVDIERVETNDLYLAFACLEGHAAGIEAFELQYLSRVPSYVERLGCDIDDVLHGMRERLLPPPLGVHGRLAEYAGRGELHAWVRVVAVRLGLDLARKRAPEPLSQAPALVVDVDPLRDVLRARYAPVLSKSLNTALSELPTRERHVLRMHFVDGVSLAAIGRVYGKNRSTVFRWLDKALSDVMARCVSIVKGQVRLSDTELSSLLRTLRSQLTIELQTLA